jgi:hypothetical protein
VTLNPGLRSGLGFSTYVILIGCREQCRQQQPAAMNINDERACFSGSYVKSTNARVIHGTTMRFSFFGLSFLFHPSRED